MLGPSEYADKFPEHQLETRLCVPWPEIRDRWLLADNELQFRDQVCNEQPVGTQRLAKGILPIAQLVFVFAQQRTKQTLERLSQRGIGDIALVLVELSRSKQAAWRHEHLVQLVYDC